MASMMSEYGVWSTQRIFGPLVWFQDERAVLHPYCMGNALGPWRACLPIHFQLLCRQFDPPPADEEADEGMKLPSDPVSLRIDARPPPSRRLLPRGPCFFGLVFPTVPGWHQPSLPFPPPDSDHAAPQLTALQVFNAEHQS